ncbi:MAG: hypothetical protein ACR2NR_20185 [Solirubrobacteraceae bacterium]
MRQRDIYDDMPDGPAQRHHNQQRLAELERDGAARRARLAEVVGVAELYAKIVAPGFHHTL